jgi:hypothetical protein
MNPHPLLWAIVSNFLILGGVLGLFLGQTPYHVVFGTFWGTMFCVFLILAGCAIPIALAVELKRAWSR